MGNYERIIGLKSVWLTIVRRFVIILIIFIPISLVSVAYTQLFMTKTYLSSITLLSDKDISPTGYTPLPSAVKSEKVAKAAEESLAKTKDDDGNPITPIKHANGSAITWEEILKGINIPSAVSTATRKVSIEYQSTEQSIAKPILEAVAKATIANNPLSGINLSISGTATTGTHSSSENKYMLIGIAAGFVLGCVLAFIDEVISDEVYDKKDIEMLGADGFEISASK